MIIEKDEILKKLCEDNNSKKYEVQFRWKDKHEAEEDIKEYFNVSTETDVEKYIFQSDFPDDKNNMYVLDSRNNYIVSLQNAIKDLLETSFDITKEELEKVYDEVIREKLVVFSLDEKNSIIKDFKNKFKLEDIDEFDDRNYFEYIPKEVLNNYENKGWNIKYIKDSITTISRSNSIEIYALIVK